MDEEQLSTSFKWSFPTSPHFIKEIIIGIILVICLGIPIHVATEYPHINTGTADILEEENDTTETTEETTNEENCQQRRRRELGQSASDVSLGTSGIRQAAAAPRRIAPAPPLVLRPFKICPHTRPEGISADDGGRPGDGKRGGGGSASGREERTLGRDVPELPFANLDIRTQQRWQEACDLLRLDFEERRSDLSSSSRCSRCHSEDRSRHGLMGGPRAGEAPGREARPRSVPAAQGQVVSRRASRIAWDGARSLLLNPSDAAAARRIYPTGAQVGAAMVAARQRGAVALLRTPHGIYRVTPHGATRKKSSSTKIGRETRSTASAEKCLECGRTGDPEFLAVGLSPLVAAPDASTRDDSVVAERRMTAHTTNLQLTSSGQRMPLDGHVVDDRNVAEQMVANNIVLESLPSSDHHTNDEHKNVESDTAEAKYENNSLTHDTSSSMGFSKTKSTIQMGLDSSSTHVKGRSVGTQASVSTRDLVCETNSEATFSNTTAKKRSSSSQTLSSEINNDPSQLKVNITSDSKITLASDYHSCIDFTQSSDSLDSQIDKSKSLTPIDEKDSSQSQISFSAPKLNYEEYLARYQCNKESVSELTPITEKSTVNENTHQDAQQKETFLHSTLSEDVLPHTKKHTTTDDTQVSEDIATDTSDNANQSNLLGESEKSKSIKSSDKRSRSKSKSKQVTRSSSRATKKPVPELSSSQSKSKSKLTKSSPRSPSRTQRTLSRISTPENTRESSNVLNTTSEDKDSRSSRIDASLSEVPKSRRLSPNVATGNKSRSEKTSNSTSEGMRSRSSSITAPLSKGSRSRHSILTASKRNVRGRSKSSDSEDKDSENRRLSASHKQDVKKSSRRTASGNVIFPPTPPDSRAPPSTSSKTVASHRTKRDPLKMKSSITKSSYGSKELDSTNTFALDPSKSDVTTRELASLPPIPSTCSEYESEISRKKSTESTPLKCTFNITNSMHIDTKKSSSESTYVTPSSSIPLSNFGSDAKITCDGQCSGNSVFSSTSSRAPESVTHDMIGSLSRTISSVSTDMPTKSEMLCTSGRCYGSGILSSTDSKHLITEKRSKTEKLLRNENICRDKNRPQTDKRPMSAKNCKTSNPNTSAATAKSLARTKFLTTSASVATEKSAKLLKSSTPAKSSTPPEPQNRPPAASFTRESPYQTLSQESLSGALRPSHSSLASQSKAETAGALQPCSPKPSEDVRPKTRQGERRRPKNRRAERSVEREVHSCQNDRERCQHIRVQTSSHQQIPSCARLCPNSVCEDSKEFRSFSRSPASSESSSFVTLPSSRERRSRASDVSCHPTAMTTYHTIRSSVRAQGAASPLHREPASQRDMPGASGTAVGAGSPETPRTIERKGQQLFRRGRRMVWRLTNQSRAVRNRICQRYDLNESPYEIDELADESASTPVRVSRREHLPSCPHFKRRNTDVEEVEEEQSQRRDALSKKSQKDESDKDRPSTCPLSSHHAPLRRLVKRLSSPRHCPRCQASRPETARTHDRDSLTSVHSSHHHTRADEAEAAARGFASPPGRQPAHHPAVRTTARAMVQRSTSPLRERRSTSGASRGEAENQSHLESKGARTTDSSVVDTGSSDGRQQMVVHRYSRRVHQTYSIVESQQTGREGAKKVASIVVLTKTEQTVEDVPVGEEATSRTSMSSEGASELRGVPESDYPPRPPTRLSHSGGRRVRSESGGSDCFEEWRTAMSTLVEPQDSAYQMSGNSPIIMRCEMPHPVPPAWTVPMPKSTDGNWKQKINLQTNPDHTVWKEGGNTSELALSGMEGAGEFRKLSEQSPCLMYGYPMASGTASASSHDEDSNVDEWVDASDCLHSTADTSRRSIRVADADVVTRRSGVFDFEEDTDEAMTTSFVISSSESEENSRFDSVFNLLMQTSKTYTKSPCEQEDHSHKKTNEERTRKNLRKTKNVKKVRRRNGGDGPSDPSVSVEPKTRHDENPDATNTMELVSSLPTSLVANDSAVNTTISDQLESGHMIMKKHRHYDSDAEMRESTSREYRSTSQRQRFQLQTSRGPVPRSGICTHPSPDTEATVARVSCVDKSDLARKRGVVPAPSKSITYANLEPMFVSLPAADAPLQRTPVPRNRYPPASNAESRSHSAASDPRASSVAPSHESKGSGVCADRYETIGESEHPPHETKSEQSDNEVNYSVTPSDSHIIRKFDSNTQEKPNIRHTGETDQPMLPLSKEPSLRVITFSNLVSQKSSSQILCMVPKPRTKHSCRSITSTKSLKSRIAQKVLHSVINKLRNIVRSDEVRGKLKLEATAAIAVAVSPALKTARSSILRKKRYRRSSRRRNVPDHINHLPGDKSEYVKMTHEKRRLKGQLPHESQSNSQGRLPCVDTSQNSEISSSPLSHVQKATRTPTLSKFYKQSKHVSKGHTPTLTSVSTSIGNEQMCKKRFILPGRKETRSIAELELCNTSETFRTVSMASESNSVHTSRENREFHLSTKECHQTTPTNDSSKENRESNNRRGRLKSSSEKSKQTSNSLKGVSDEIVVNSRVVVEKSEKQSKQKTHFDVDKHIEKEGVGTKILSYSNGSVDDTMKHKSGTENNQCILSHQVDDKIQNIKCRLVTDDSGPENRYSQDNSKNSTSQESMYTYCVENESSQERTLHMKGSSSGKDSFSGDNSKLSSNQELIKKSRKGKKLEYTLISEVFSTSSANLDYVLDNSLKDGRHESNNILESEQSNLSSLQNTTFENSSSYLEEAIEHETEEESKKMPQNIFYNTSQSEEEEKEKKNKNMKRGLTTIGTNTEHISNKKIKQENGKLSFSSLKQIEKVPPYSDSATISKGINTEEVCSGNCKSEFYFSSDFEEEKLRGAINLTKRKNQKLKSSQFSSKSTCTSDTFKYRFKGKSKPEIYSSLKINKQKKHQNSSCQSKTNSSEIILKDTDRNDMQRIKSSRHKQGTREESHSEKTVTKTIWGNADDVSIKISENERSQITYDIHEQGHPHPIMTEDRCTSIDTDLISKTSSKKQTTQHTYCSPRDNVQNKHGVSEHNISSEGNKVEAVARQTSTMESKVRRGERTTDKIVHNPAFQEHTSDEILKRDWNKTNVHTDEYDKNLCLESVESCTGLRKSISTLNLTDSKPASSISVKNELAGYSSNESRSVDYTEIIPTYTSKKHQKKPKALIHDTKSTQAKSKHKSSVVIIHSRKVKDIVPKTFRVDSEVSASNSNHNINENQPDLGASDSTVVPMAILPEELLEKHVVEVSTIAPTIERVSYSPPCDQVCYHEECENNKNKSWNYSLNTENCCSQSKYRFIDSDITTITTNKSIKEYSEVATQSIEDVFQCNPMRYIIQSTKTIINKDHSPRILSQNTSRSSQMSNLSRKSQSTNVRSVRSRKLKKTSSRNFTPREHLSNNEESELFLHASRKDESLKSSSFNLQSTKCNKHKSQQTCNCANSTETTMYSLVSDSLKSISEWQTSESHISEIRSIGNKSKTIKSTKSRSTQWEMPYTTKCYTSIGHSSLSKSSRYEKASRTRYHSTRSHSTQWETPMSRSPYYPNSVTTISQTLPVPSTISQESKFKEICSQGTESSPIKGSSTSIQSTDWSLPKSQSRTICSKFSLSRSISQRIFTRRSRLLRRLSTVSQPISRTRRKTLENVSLGHLLGTSMRSQSQSSSNNSRVTEFLSERNKLIECMSCTSPTLQKFSPRSQSLGSRSSESCPMRNLSSARSERCSFFGQLVQESERPCPEQDGYDGNFQRDISSSRLPIKSNQHFHLDQLTDNIKSKKCYHIPRSHSPKRTLLRHQDMSIRQKLESDKPRRLTDILTQRESSELDCKEQISYHRSVERRPSLQSPLRQSLLRCFPIQRKPLGQSPVRQKSLIPESTRACSYQSTFCQPSINRSLCLGQPFIRRELIKHLSTNRILRSASVASSPISQISSKQLAPRQSPTRSHSLEKTPVLLDSMIKPLEKILLQQKRSSQCLSNFTSEGQSPERQSPERRSPEQQSPERQSLEWQSLEWQSLERQSVERQQPERQPPERQSPKRQSSERKSSERQREEQEPPKQQLPLQQSPERQSTERLSPERQSPERQLQDRLSTNRLSPERLSPERLSPERLSPERLSPERHTKRKPSERQSPVRQSPDRHSPERQSPVRQSPVRQSPIRQSPIRQSPIRQSPVRQSPVRLSPVRQSPVRLSPVRQPPQRQSTEQSAENISIVNNLLFPHSQVEQIPKRHSPVRHSAMQNLPTVYETSKQTPEAISPERVAANRNSSESLSSKALQEISNQFLSQPKTSIDNTVTVTDSQVKQIDGKEITKKMSQERRVLRSNELGKQTSKMSVPEWRTTQRTLNRSQSLGSHQRQRLSPQRLPKKENQIQIRNVEGKQQLQSLPRTQTLIIPSGGQYSSQKEQSPENQKRGHVISNPCAYLHEEGYSLKNVCSPCSLVKSEDMQIRSSKTSSTTCKNAWKERTERSLSNRSLPKKLSDIATQKLLSGMHLRYQYAASLKQRNQLKSEGVCQIGTRAASPLSLSPKKYSPSLSQSSEAAEISPHRCNSPVRSVDGHMSRKLHIPHPTDKVQTEHLSLRRGSLVIQDEMQSSTFEDFSPQRSAKVSVDSNYDDVSHRSSRKIACASNLPTNKSPNATSSSRHAQHGQEDLKLGTIHEGDIVSPTVCVEETGRVFNECGQTTPDSTRKWVEAHFSLNQFSALPIPPTSSVEASPARSLPQSAQESFHDATLHSPRQPSVSSTQSASRPSHLHSPRDSPRHSTGDMTRDSLQQSAPDSPRHSTLDSARDSPRDSVWDTVRDSVRDSARDSPRDSARDSTRDSARDSARDSTLVSDQERLKDSITNFSHGLPRGMYYHSPRDSPCESFHDSFRDSPRDSIYDLSYDVSQNSPRHSNQDSPGHTTRESPLHSDRGSPRHSAGFTRLIRDSPRDLSCHSTGDSSQRSARGSTANFARESVRVPHQNTSWDLTHDSPISSLQDSPRSSRPHSPRCSDQRSRPDSPHSSICGSPGGSLSRSPHGQSRFSAQSSPRSSGQLSHRDSSRNTGRVSHLGSRRNSHSALPKAHSTTSIGATPHAKSQVASSPPSSPKSSQSRSPPSLHLRPPLPSLSPPSLPSPLTSPLRIPSSSPATSPTPSTSPHSTGSQPMSSVLTPSDSNPAASQRDFPKVMEPLHLKEHDLLKDQDETHETQQLLPESRGDGQEPPPPQAHPTPPLPTSSLESSNASSPPPPSPFLHNHRPRSRSVTTATTTVLRSGIRHNSVTGCRECFRECYIYTPHQLKVLRVSCRLNDPRRSPSATPPSPSPTPSPPPSSSADTDDAWLTSALQELVMKQSTPPNAGTPADGYPAPADPAPGCTAPGDPAPGCMAPGDPAPGCTSPGDPSPGCTAPGDPAPGCTAPSDPAPGGMAPGHPAPGCTAPGDPAPGCTAPGDPAPGCTAPSCTAPSCTARSDPAPGCTAPGHLAPGCTAPGHLAPGCMAPGHLAPGCTAPGDPAPGCTAPSCTAPSDPAPGCTSPGHLAPGCTALGDLAPTPHSSPSPGSGPELGCSTSGCSVPSVSYATEPSPRCRSHSSSSSR